MERPIDKVITKTNHNQRSKYTPDSYTYIPAFPALNVHLLRSIKYIRLWESCGDDLGSDQTVMGRKLTGKDAEKISKGRTMRRCRCTNWFSALLGKTASRGSHAVLFSEDRLQDKIFTYQDVYKELHIRRFTS